MIKAHNLTVTFDRRAVIHHLHFHLDQGKTLAILGPNGSGKSTLLRVLAGLISNFDGVLKLGFTKKQLGYLPQQSQIDRNLPVTVEDLVLMGLLNKLGTFQKPSPLMIERANQVLEQMNLERLRRLPINSLSGGQMQRALWARLLLLDPEVILLDEPFSYLDESALKSVLQVILKWRAEKKTLVVVLHDSELASKISDQVLSLAPVAPIAMPNPTLCLNDLTVS